MIYNIFITILVIAGVASMLFFCFLIGGMVLSGLGSPAGKLEKPIHIVKATATGVGVMLAIGLVTGSLW
ncbi:hypothetical protein R2G56_21090 [Nitratireductor aquimarinus]|uniref:Uncharacterized protein n=1 Tax=Nitratireductor aquimarinus TaxID=889300 RepID=A0ABU4ARB3_9HYPH|nr:hypothetical protein [Nitratireductor aquimarinus]MDV6228791.1 hypothetical protein [Nitratireductor aquimarinus]